MNTSKEMSKNSNIVRGEFRRGFLARVFEQIKSWNERRVAIRQLHMLSDRMLNDIGIDRAQIESAVSWSGSYAPIGAEQFGRPKASPEIRRAA